jgi:DNA-directed RNA polymerase specialized sigma24 family protein
MMSRNEGSVTRILGDFKEGDPAAIEALWQLYFGRLVAIARRKLQHHRRLVVADEEDAALSAFKSFHRRVRRGDFPRLADRDDLWVQLVTLTQQKVVDLKRREGAAKRGGGRVLRGSDVDADADGRFALEALIGGGPDPEFAAIMTEECRCLLDRLGDETLRQVALLKLGLFSHQEIADRFGRSVAWVNRKLELIRDLWGDRFREHGHTAR